MDSSQAAYRLPPEELRHEYRVVALLKTTDSNLFITDSRDRALMAFEALLKQRQHYRQIYIQVGMMVFDQGNLERLP
jgi:hypothetical protein